MDEKSQITMLSDDVDKLNHRYRTEFDISYAAVVGVLTMKVHLLCGEAEQVASEEDEG